MNWMVLIQLIMELISRLRKAENEGQIQAIDWERLLQFLPQILDLIFKIIGNMKEEERIQVESTLSNLAEPQAIDWEKLIPVIIELLKLFGLIKQV